MERGAEISTICQRKRPQKRSVCTPSEAGENDPCIDSEIVEEESDAKEERVSMSNRRIARKFSANSFLRAKKRKWQDHMRFMTGLSRRPIQSR